MRWLLRLALVGGVAGAQSLLLAQAGEKAKKEESDTSASSEEPSKNAAQKGPVERYPYYTYSRRIPAEGSFECPDVPLEHFQGDTVRYQKTGRFNPAFIKRLRKFEKILIQEATKVYGRAPTKLKHLGSFYCRRIRTYPTYISEHGLGNAIDIAEFVFPRAKKGQRKELEIDGKRLPVPRHSFRVSVVKHWDKKKGRGRIHHVFLHALIRRLLAEEDLFFVLLGPGYPGHNNHFHFDNSPYRLVDGFRDL